VTADNTSSTVINDSYLTSVRELISIPFQYPRHAMVGIRSLATDTLSGSLRFSAICDCLIIRTWDGSSWHIEFSKNPAWVLFDVLTQPIYSGTGATGDPLVVIRYDGINPSRLDLIKFKEWADYCDEYVPSGVGILTEKRITFNGGFDAETNLWDAAMTVCQVGGAVLVWNGVKLTLAIDKPADPVQLFSVGNTGVDSFTETFVSMEDRAAEIEVDFTNSENDYNRDKVTITNANIPTIASKVGLQMVGVTKPSEAWRIAKKRLLYNEFITRTVSWKADIDAIACTVGDVVLLQSDVPQWGFGGRLVSATTTSVVLDREVVIAAATSYTIMVRIADDTIVERTISNAPGTTNTLTVASAFTTAPSQYDVYTFGISNQEAKPFRISTIQKSGDLEATLSAVEYNVNVYNDEGDPAIPTVTYSQLETWPTITGLILTEQVVQLSDGNVTDKINITYNTISDTSRFPKVEVLYSESGSSFISGGIYTSNESVSITAVKDIVYKIIVRAVNNAGQYQPISLAVSGTIMALGFDVTVPNITGLELFGQANDAQFVGRDIKLCWNKVSPLTNDIADGPAAPAKYPGWFRYYELRILSGTTLLRTEPLQTETYDYDYEKNHKDCIDKGFSGAARTVTVEVRCVATLGDSSAIAARITVSNEAAPIITTLVLRHSVKTIYIEFGDISAQVPDVATYEIHVSTTPDFTPSGHIAGVGTCVNVGKESSYAYKVPDLGDYYVRVGAVDNFGPDGMLYSDAATISVDSSTQLQVKGFSFLRGISQPSTPTGGSFAAPSATGWSDGIPTDNNQPLWMTTRVFTSDGLTPQQSAWTSPEKIATPSTGAKVQFSVNGSTFWHDTPTTGDMYMRSGTSTDNGVTWTYGGATLIKGEDGNPGAPGVNTATVILYQRTTTNSAPSFSSGSIGNYTFSTGVLSTPPTGWTQTIPTSAGDYLWFVTLVVSSPYSTVACSSGWGTVTLLSSNGLTVMRTTVLGGAVLFYQADDAGGFTFTGPTFPNANGTKALISFTADVLAGTTVSGHTHCRFAVKLYRSPDNSTWTLIWPTDDIFTYWTHVLEDSAVASTIKFSIVVLDESLSANSTYYYKAVVSPGLLPSDGGNEYCLAMKHINFSATGS
jgi:hypothetical protein